MFSDQKPAAFSSFFANMSAEEESKMQGMEVVAATINAMAESVVSSTMNDAAAPASAPAAEVAASAMADDEFDSEPISTGNAKRASRSASNAPIINDLSGSSESSGDEGAGYDADEYAAARGTYTAHDLEYQNESESAIACGLPPTYMTPLELESMPEFASYSQIYVDLRNTICRQWQKALHAYLTFDEYARRSFLDDDRLKASAKRVFDFLNVHGYINCGLLHVKQGAPQSRPKEQQMPAVHSLLTRRKSDQNLAATGPSSPIKRQNSNGSTPAVVKEESTSAAMDTTAAASTLAPPAAAAKSESLVKDEPFSPIAPATPLLALSLNQPPTPVPSPDLPVSSPNCTAAPLPSPAPAAPASVFKRIIVIGAGASGLAAARQLASFGHTVTVLEGRERVGGRVNTIRDKFSAPVDLGASIMTGLLGSPLNVLCKQHMQTGMEVGFSTATTFAKSTVEAPASPFPTLMHYIQHSCVIYDEHGVPVQEDIDHRAEAIFNKLLEGEYALKRNSGIEAEAPADSQLTPEEMDKMRLPNPKDIYNMDVATGLEVCRKAIGLRLTPAEQKLFDWHAANLEYGCATALDKLSLVYWDQDDAMAWEGDHALIKPGFATFIEALRGDNELDIRLGQHVKEIHYAAAEQAEAAAASSAAATASPSSSSSSSDSPVLVTALDTATNELRSYPADLVLCTASLGVLKTGSLQFHPALPSWKSQAISTLGFGLLNKLILEFPAPFWKTKNDADMFGWIHPGPSKSRGKFYIFWNLERSTGKPILAALCAGEAAFSTEAESEAALVAECMGALRAIHSEQKVPDPIVTHQTRWSQDEFARGSYSYLAAGNNGTEYDLLAKPVGNTLFFAGEACNRDYPATVPGAYLSGLRASGVMQAQIIGWNRSNPGPDVLRELSKQQKNEVLSKPDAHATALKQQAVRELFQQGASGENALQLKVAEILARQQQRRRHRGIRNDWGKGEGAVGEDGAPVAGEESMAARLEAAAQLLKRGVFNVPRESVKSEPENRYAHIKRFEGELENPFAARVHDLQGLNGFVSFAEFAANTLGLQPSRRVHKSSRKSGKHSKSHKKDKHRGDKRDRASAAAGVSSSSSSKKKEDRHKKKARSSASSSDASSPEALIKRYVSKVVDGCKSSLAASVLQQHPKLLSSVHHRAVAKVLQDWQSKPRGDLAMHLWLNDKRKAAIKELVERYLRSHNTKRSSSERVSGRDESWPHLTCVMLLAPLSCSQSQNPQSSPSSGAAAAAASSSSSSTAAYPAQFAQQPQAAFPMFPMDPRMLQQQPQGAPVAASAVAHQPRFFPSNAH